MQEAVTAPLCALEQLQDIQDRLRRQDAQDDIWLLAHFVLFYPAYPAAKQLQLILLNGYAIVGSAARLY